MRLRKNGLAVHGIADSTCVARATNDMRAARDEDATRRGGRAAEGARLESVYAGNCIAGSNPAPSAISVPEWARRLRYRSPQASGAAAMDQVGEESGTDDDLERRHRRMASLEQRLHRVERLLVDDRRDRDDHHFANRVSSCPDVVGGRYLRSLAIAPESPSPLRTRIVRVCARLFPAPRRKNTCRSAARRLGGRAVCVRRARAYQARPYHAPRPARARSGAHAR